MTTSLVLNSLEIRQFRTFHHLRIERLGRVNLVVGKNNVGKTSLLEALQLYAHRGSPTLIWELLAIRNESNSPSSTSGYVSLDDQVLTIKYLFHRRLSIQNQLAPIQIGPMDSQDNVLSITVRWYEIKVDAEGRREWLSLRPEEYEKVDTPVLGLAVQMGTQPKTFYRLDRYLGRRITTSLPLEPSGIRCIFIAANGLSQKQIGTLWDSIALTDLQDIVLSSLRLIAPEVEGVTLVDTLEYRRERDRIPIVKIKDDSDPVPLRSIGEGMSRLFGIALALVNARDGLLLIDEIESGLHYSVQADLWRLIFQVAHQLNVQVFATSHSWDCIAAFQEAAQEHQEKGMLIRLEDKKGKVTATLFDERKLGIATREQIEVR